MKRAKDLYSKIIDMDNLRLAHQNARKGKSKYAQVKMVDSDPDKWLKKIQEMLVNKSFYTSKYRVFKVNDRGKDRDICDLPYYPDRIVHWALMLVIEPIFISTFIKDTYAAIPNRGIHSALYSMHEHMKDRESTKYCLKTDIRKFFPSIDKEILKTLIRRKIKCKDTLWLIDEIIDSYNDSGIPIGNYTSQYFGNFYLTYFDHWIKETDHEFTYTNEEGVEVHESKKVLHYFRYADDMIFMDNSKEFLHQLFKDMEKYLKENLKLQFKSNHQVFPTYKRGVDFVGYRSFGDFTLVRNRTKKIIKSLSKHLQWKIKNGYPLTPTELGCIASYYGAITWGDTYRLFCSTFKKLRDPKLKLKYKRRRKPK